MKDTKELALLKIRKIIKMYEENDEVKFPKYANDEYKKACFLLGTYQKLWNKIDNNPAIFFAIPLENRNNIEDVKNWLKDNLSTIKQAIRG